VSALAYLRPRRDYALVRSFVLAALVHVLLVAIMVLGVRWQSRPAESVTVELWEPPPPPPAVEAPKPPPKVEPPKPEPKPEPEPEVKKPEIVEKVVPPKPEPKPKPKPEPKPEPKPKPKPEPKPVPPKVDEFQRQMAREQLAMEQRRLDEERRRAAEEQRKAAAERQAATARDKALSTYIQMIRNKVRRNWILPPDLQGNPEAIFNVSQLPTGEVLNITVVKSSGNPAYDEAVRRAILKSSPLPLPEPRSLFDRELKLTFRPRD
jgi:colicin import membrane protein